ncbi:MAG: aminoglycoside phosphotransferase family protein [Syntrophobacteraceae bacterium]
MTKDRGTRGGKEDSVPAAAEKFAPGAGICDIREYGNGNINDTFLVSLGSGAERHFILQRVNRRIFRRPALVMRNLRTLGAHVQKRLENLPAGRGGRFEIPRVLLTRDLRDHWIGPGRSFWRAMSFIEGARSFDTVRDLDHAEEVGRALGTFHALVSDLPSDTLADTLEGFHVTPLYLQRYDEVTGTAVRLAASPEVRRCVDFVSARRDLAGVLEDARSRGVLRLQPIHGDPKSNNILLDTTTRRAVAIVDLDTVKPGLVHYDIGDCLRSACNPLGEETGDWEAVGFDPDLCRAVLRGYFSAARSFLTRKDREYIFDAVRLIAFELGLRFFTDHLEGDVYFKTRREGQNLSRALVQFRLAESIESREGVIREIIGEMA